MLVIALLPGTKLARCVGHDNVHPRPACDDASLDDPCVKPTLGNAVAVEQHVIAIPEVKAFTASAGRCEPQETEGEDAGEDYCLLPMQRRYG